MGEVAAFEVGGFRVGGGEDAEPIARVLAEARFAHVAVPTHGVAMGDGIVSDGQQLVKGNVVGEVVTPVVGAFDGEGAVKGIM